MNVIVCSNCGTQKNSVFTSEVCVVCGNIAVVPPLTDGAFERVGEDNEPIAFVKPRTESKDRTPEEGGRTF